MRCHKLNFVSFVFALTLLSVLGSSTANAATAKPGEESVEETAISRAQLPQNSTFWSKMRENFSVGYFNFASSPMEQVHLAAGRIETYNYFTFDYRFTKQYSLSVRPVFTWATAGTNAADRYMPSEIKLGDAYLNFRDRNLALLPYDVKLSAQYRLYAPTSESSNSRGLIARLRPWFEFERRMNRDWTVTFNIEPDYYFNSITGYVTDRGDVRGNKHFGYETSLEVERKLTRDIGLGASIGHEQSWAHGVPARSKDPVFDSASAGGARVPTNTEPVKEVYRSEAVSLQASANYSYGPAFFVLGVSQKRDVARPRDEFSLFNAKETQYFLLTSLRF